MKYCPKCDSVIHEDAIFCQYCGHNTLQPPPEEKTETGEQEASQEHRGPRLMQAVTPVKTVFGLVFLILALWGLTISTAALLLYLKPEMPTAALLISLVPQMILRGFFAYWAVEDREISSTMGMGGKIALMIMAFVPLLSVLPFVYTSRGLIRKDRFDFVTVSAVVITVGTAVVAASTHESLSPVLEPLTSGRPLTNTTPDLFQPTQGGEQTPQETAEVSQLETPVQNTPYSDKGASIPSSCVNPSMVTVEDEGENMEVCGRVTNYGVIDCPTCPRGMYSFIKLEGTFQIVSYDWRFSFAWLDDCLRVADTVEILGEKPVFVFGKGEGYAGTECITDARGELICEGGEYFQDFNGCR